MTRFLEADRNGDVRGTYDLSCAKDRAAVDFDFYREKEQERATVQRALRSRSSFVIGEIELNPSGAIAHVRKEFPRATPALEELGNAAAEGRPVNAELVAKLLLDPKNPQSSERSMYYLVKDPEGWRVSRLLAKDKY